MHAYMFVWKVMQEYREVYMYKVYSSFILSVPSIRNCVIVWNYINTVEPRYKEVGYNKTLL